MFYVIFADNERTTYGSDIYFDKPMGELAQGVARDISNESHHGEGES